MAHPTRTLQPPTPPVRIDSLPGRAEADLRLIRDTMAASRTFTHISGPSIIALGVLGCAAGWLASALDVGESPAAASVPGVEYWTTWGCTAVVGFALGFLGLDRRARRPGEPIGAGVLRGAGRRFTFGVLPPLVAGAVITPPLLQGGGRWVPGLWLVLYGIALIAGGMTSLRVVRVLGAAFFILGAITLQVTSWGEASLVIGFGGLHLVFGVWITLGQRKEARHG